MSRTILFTITLLLGTIMLTAQNTFSETGSADPEAKKILDKLKETVESASDVHYTFELGIEFPEMPVERMEGSLAQKGEKFVMKMGNQHVYSNAEAMWLHDMDMNVVQIYDADFGSEGEFMSPADFMNIYNSPDYTYAIEDQWMEGSEMVSSIVFKPLSEDSEYFKMTMEVPNSGTLINNLKVFAKDGSRYMLKILNITLENGYDDTYFVLDTENLKDIQIENLRID